MQVIIQVSAEVERVSGPFASRDDIEAELISEVEGADPGSLQPGDNEYEVQMWEVEALPVGKAKTKPKASPDVLIALQMIRADHERLSVAVKDSTPVEGLLADLSMLNNHIDHMSLKLQEAGLVKLG